MMPLARISRAVSSSSWVNRLVFALVFLVFVAMLHLAAALCPSRTRLGLDDTTSSRYRARRMHAVDRRQYPSGIENYSAGRACFSAGMVSIASGRDLSVVPAGMPPHNLGQI